MDEAAVSTPDIDGLSGYLHRNWLRFDRPAVLLNPEARPEDLLSWCWGEVASLLAAAEIAGQSQHELTVNDFTAIFLHRLRPLNEMFNVAMSGLHEEEGRRRAAGRETRGPGAPLQVV